MSLRYLLAAATVLTWVAIIFRCWRADVAAARRNAARRGVADGVRKMEMALRSGDLNALPGDLNTAWTPEEREAFGLNDTARLIDQIARELETEWRRRDAALVRRTQTDSLLPDDDDDDEVVTMLTGDGQVMRRYVDYWPIVKETIG